MLPLINDLAVNKKKWLTKDESIDCMAVSQALPGVIAINSAIYIGYRQKGFLGALVSVIGVVLPSFTIIILAVLFLDAINSNPYINGVFEGVKAASAGLVAVAAYQLGKNVLKDKLNWIIAVVSFLAIVTLQINAVFAIIFGGFIGYVSYLYYKIKSKSKERGEK